MPDFPHAAVERPITPAESGQCGNRTITLTKITAIKPARISKVYTLDMNGGLVKHGGGQLVEGHADLLQLDDPEAFALLLTELTPNNALMYGVFPHSEAQIVTREDFGRTKGQSAKNTLPQVTRTKEMTSWASGPGIMMLDHDPADESPPLTRDELLAALYKTLPDLNEAPHIWRPSSSSFLYTMDGTELQGLRGQRVYMFVRDPYDIERASKVLQHRLWLLGFGYIRISTSGRMLERTIVDGAVFQPSRLDFAGGASCGVGVTQRLPPPEIISGPGEYIDTRLALPDLSPRELEHFGYIRSAARTAKGEQSAKVREEWIDARVAEGMAAVSQNDQAKRKKLGEVLASQFRNAVENKELFGDFPIVMDCGERVTVGKIVDNPKKYHNRRTRDPLEPEYHGGRPVGWLDLRSGGKPFLFSHAHGGHRFSLIRARKTLEVMKGEQAALFSQTMELVQLDGAIFERSGHLVRISDGEIRPVTEEWFELYLSQLVSFISYKIKGEDICTVPENVPRRLVQVIIGATGEWGLPTLNGLVDAPIIDPTTGRVLDKSGFDDKTGLMVKIPISLPSVPLRPDTCTLEAAAKKLWKPFEKFPFSDMPNSSGGHISRAVCLSAVLTAVVRPLLPTAPGFLISAPAAGTGKTLLAKCFSAFASGGSPDIMGVPEHIDENEMGKILLAKGRKGARTIILDNVAGVFKSAALCSFMTTPRYESRVLGKSETESVNTNSLFVITGNNPSIAGDLNRRLLRCELDPASPTPHKRSFALDPFDYCQAHRQELVRCALTLLSGWIAAGRPRYTSDRMASFEDWSDTVRQCVIWLGEQGLFDVCDPLLSIDAGFEVDPETQQLRAIVNSWWDQFGDRHMTAKEIAKQCNTAEGAPLYNALEEAGVIDRDGVNARKLGNWLRGHTARLVGSLRVMRAGTRSNSIVWKVENVGNTHGNNTS